MPRSDGSGAPPILCNVPGSYPWGVLHERQPALLGRTGRAFPYPPEIRRALDDLLEEALSGLARPLPAGEHDQAEWAEWGRGFFGLPWSDLPFLWMENYFHRRLLGAVGWFGDGPWRGIDPFGPFKREELDGKAVDDELSALDRLGSLDRLGTEAEAARDGALLLASLWGNRADLGFSMPGVGPVLADRDDRDDADGETGETGGHDPANRRGNTGSGGLVADDSALLWSLLDGSPAGTVFLVADNAGRELLPDLVLVDHLLETGRAESLVIHVKPRPYFVSDATTGDVVALLRRMTSAPGRAATIAHRLWHALGSGRLRIRSHPFSCAPLPYHAMPDDLRDEFAGASVTIMKGDLNYRKLVGDRHWPATTPFAEVTAHFPGPVAALRTLKSDVVTGLAPETLTALEGSGRLWRTSGTHAMVQVSTPRP